MILNLITYLTIYLLNYYVFIYNRSKLVKNYKIRILLIFIAIFPFVVNSSVYTRNRSLIYADRPR